MTFKIKKVYITYQFHSTEHLLLRLPMNTDSSSKDYLNTVSKHNGL